MANVVVLPGRGQAEAARERRQLVGIKALSETGEMLGRAIQMYGESKERREAQDLTIVDSMVKMYGPDVGQDTLKKYDSLLAKRGLGLPRDSSGQLVPPPPTMDQQFAAALRRDPETLKAAMEKKLTGHTEWEKLIEERKVTSLENYRKLRADAAVAQADAARIRATSPSKQQLVGQQDTGMVRIPDALAQEKGLRVPIVNKSEAIKLGGGALPEGSRELKKVELDAELKTLKDARDLTRFSNHLINEEGKQVYRFMEGIAKGTIDLGKKENKAIARYIFNQKDEDGEPMVNQDLQDRIFGEGPYKGMVTNWMERLFGGVPPAIRAEMEKKISAEEAAGTIPSVTAPPEGPSRTGTRRLIQRGD